MRERPLKDFSWPALSAARSRAAAPMSRTPVTPLPIAASVSATSTANRRIQTSDSSSP